MAKTNRHRNLVLKINYYKGLISEYEKRYDAFIKKETELIEDYYQEDFKPLKQILDGYFKNDAIRDKKIEKFDKKHYWQRRKLKTKLIRKKVDEKDIENQLAEYDDQTKIKKDDLIQSLLNKYPHKNLDTTVEQKIQKLNEHKKKSLEKMNQKGETLKTKIQSFIEKTNKRIDALNERKEKLEKDIIEFNKQRDQRDAQKIKDLKENLEALKIRRVKGENIPETQIEKLEKEIQRISIYKNMLEDESVHLSIRNLKMYFGGVKAVNDLSFDVKKGEVFGLIGPNGAGKTTVFNCITQFYKATAGEMIFRNKENHIVNLYDFKTHHMIKEGIARSFQNVELIWELTVLDNLMVAAHSLLVTSFLDHMAHTRKLSREDKVIRSRGYQILKDLGIEAYAFRSPYGLPYGVLKKVELARTLMTDPSLIILDEPAAGLNDAETEDLAKVIKKINHDYGVTIFLVEHDMGLVMSICDRICAISFGKRIGLGTPKEIQNNVEVKKAYLGDDDDE